MPTAIVTDTTADLPPELIEALPIHIVPNILVLNGKSFLDGQDISRETFYALLAERKTIPTTAAPASGAFLSLYKRLLSLGFSHIISIHPPSVLSGIYNSASIAAKMVGKAVTVWDSSQLSLGIGFQVLAAAEAATSNLSVPEILEKVMEVRLRVKVAAMLDTLEYVRRSGRVSWARASLGSLLNIKPFIELKDGKVLGLGEVRTRHKGIERLRNMIQELGPLERLAILHTNAESEARTFLSNLDIQLTSLPFIVNVTTVIGTHVGPNGLGFAALLK